MRNKKLDYLKGKMGECIRPELKDGESYGEYMHRCIHPESGESLADISVLYQKEVEKMSSFEFGRHILASKE